MPRLTRPLSTSEIEKSKPQNTTKYLCDGSGLYLEVTPKEKKLWRFKYRIAGKAKLISFGHYPDISLSEARELRHEARNKVARGVARELNNSGVLTARGKVGCWTVTAVKNALLRFQ